MVALITIVLAIILVALQSIWWVPYNPEYLALPWPWLWLVFWKAETAPLPGALGVAAAAGVSAEIFSAAPFGTALGPLLLIVALYCRARYALLDHRPVSRYLWSLTAITLFFSLRALLIGNSQSLLALLAANSIGYSLLYVSGHRISS